MPGRRLLSEAEINAMGHGLQSPDFRRRRAVLSETIQAFDSAGPADRYHRLALANLQRWHGERKEPSEPAGKVLIRPGDWGEVTLALTKQYGMCFAVLNMANAYVPGGAYIEGTIAQEENMFRRTDCHFHIGPQEYDATTDRYRPEMTSLLSAENGVVYLDTDQIRVCIRGPEDRSKDDLGYPWLADDEVFPYYELRAAAQDLRAAAQDLRDGSAFDREDMRGRIAAQLNTLRQKKIRHVVFGAFGCGAFQNPAEQVAQIYKEEIAKYRTDFAVVAFAIFAAGYGPGNYKPFSKVFAD